MKIIMNPSDEIKSRLDIVEVIRDYIPLKAAGMNFRANCPFHNEKTPSFMVSPEKQIWHCFGCSKGGDLISFVMEMEGISFVEALRVLAPKAGVKLERQDPKIASQRNRLLDILDLSSKYYHKVLTDSKLAEAARDYLEKRGLSDETIEEWRIGYSPESWDDLTNFLKSKGYREDEIFAAGMSAKKEGMNRFYNRFRGRIMFPICDANGNVVAFSARVSPEKEATEKMGKYINSPQTMVYDKSKILFGLDKAKMEIKKQNLAIIVEGQMDVITAHQAGFKNVVASSGTALTGEQVKLLQRYTNNLAFALDADAAGQMATDRGEDVVYNADYKEIASEDRWGRTQKYIDPALSFNVDIKIIEIKNGKDPDECIRKNPGDWQKAVENAKPVMQYHFDKIFTGLDLDKVDNRREAAKKMLAKIGKLNNKIEQDYWLKKLGQKIDVAENYLYEALAQAKKQGTSKYAQTGERDGAPRSARQNREELLSEVLLALMLKFSSFAEYALNRVNSDHIIGTDNKAIYKNLAIYYNKAINDWTESGQGDFFEINYHNFKEWLARAEAESAGRESQLRFLDKLAILADKDFTELSHDEAKAEIIKIITFLKRNYLSHRLKEISKLIMLAEKDSGGKKELISLMNELKSLTEELAGVEE